MVPVYDKELATLVCDGRPMLEHHDNDKSTRRLVFDLATRRMVTCDTVKRRRQASVRTPDSDMDNRAVRVVTVLSENDSTRLGTATETVRFPEMETSSVNDQ
ncbi:hypothetical protein KP79_PYT08375 [Mizuhopecten yessoensis]|uniref:Uncharacterized protein n=1 Tax=Mizuhopecten yessoensis TaxID=6573 RepID=A0A210QET4_MIZYE|nr:hypothetical protein KP79_PYT08375 [Mizuhopecten yessoensis]